MITLTRLNGATFALNDQFVERVEANPDTVVILADGKKFIVAETVADVVEQIRQSRADVVVRANMVEVLERAAPDLRLVTSPDGQGPSGDEGQAVAPVSRIDDHAEPGDEISATDSAQEGRKWIP